MKRNSLTRLLGVPAILAMAVGAVSAEPPIVTPTLATGLDAMGTTPVAITISDEAVQSDDAKQATKQDGDGAKPCSAGCDAAKGCSCSLIPPLNKAAAGAYKNMFYDNDFRYLCDPAYCDWHLGERLKRIGIGDGILLDVGGQYRARYHAERNIRNGGIPNGLGLTGRDDDFLLHRTRVYLNAEVGERVRFYGEALDAVSNYEDYTPRPIEENRLDIQNLFLDVVLMDACRGTLTARVGRQELQFGSQRMVSPLDWANSRRTFDAAMLMWRGDDWDIDGFYSSYAIRKNPDYLTKVDPSDGDYQMYGVYSTYKGLCRDKIDFYWLAHDNYVDGYQYDTLGTRYWGEQNNWLYEAEGAYQFGTRTNDANHSAGAWTLGLGRKLARAPWNPTLWFYYDWASGSNDGTGGFDHYYPLAHLYLGLMDLYSRKNVEDINLLLKMSPHERVKFLAWFHVFRLQNGNDVPYNLNNSAYAGLAPGTSVSRDLGTELDLILDFTLTERTDLLFGYSHFWAGDYYTAPGSVAPVSTDADFFYTQFTVNF